MDTEGSQSSLSSGTDNSPHDPWYGNGPSARALLRRRPARSTRLLSARFEFNLGLKLSSAAGAEAETKDKHAACVCACARASRCVGWIHSADEAQSRRAAAFRLSPSPLLFVYFPPEGHITTSPSSGKSLIFIFFLLTEIITARLADGRLRNMADAFFLTLLMLY